MNQRGRPNVAGHATGMAHRFGGKLWTSPQMNPAPAAALLTIHEEGGGGGRGGVFTTPCVRRERLPPSAGWRFALLMSTALTVAAGGRLVGRGSCGWTA